MVSTVGYGAMDDRQCDLQRGLIAWAELELVSSHIAVSRHNTDTLEPDMPSDWHNHGAVLTETWFHA